ncbi:MAG TPA: cell envelope integrity protein CreD [Verrucomicrobiota bacterium]|nr:cell envelope integrity protein CreD [Verrucomicrobiota bacterium]
MNDTPVSPSPTAPPPTPSPSLHRFNTVVRLIVIAVLVIAGLIPLSLIRGVLSERRSRYHEAIENITSTWGRPQVIAGPILVVPYQKHYKTWKNETVGDRIERVEALETRVHRASFLPESLEVTGELKPDRLHRGIYETVVYRAGLKMVGRFNRPSFEDWKVAPEDVLWDDAILVFTITDLRGAKEALSLKWGDQTVALEPGARMGDRAGVHARLRGPSFPSDTVNFELALNLNGSHNLSFAPFGRQNRVQLTSAWPDPSFNGAFLPSTRKVTADGFEALWEMSYYGRNYPQQWSDEDSGDPLTGTTLSQSLFGVALVPLLDVYRYVERSIKYGVLFLALVFTTFFLFEVRSPLRVHPFQYTLVGAALCLFYLGLLSLSEFWAFGLAYAAGAAASTLLISLYSLRILHSGWRTLIVSAGLVGIYTFLYVILREQEYSLLIGTAGLFAALAAVMYATRNIDWYARDAE